MDGLKRFATRTRAEGLVILLVALGYLWETNNIPEFYQLPDAPGPTTFPWLLGTVFALAGVWLIVSPLELFAPAKTPDVVAGQEATAGGGLRWLTANWHFYALWAVALAYLWLMPDLGFPLATFLLIAVFTRLLGETRPSVCIGLAVVATVVIYFGFKFGLNVRLPLGLLDSWFK